MRIALTLFLTLVLASTATARMISVSSYVANIHSSPSLNEYNVVLQAPRYYPLSVKGSQDRFYRVVDYQGRSGWIHDSVVSNTPTVIVNIRRANIRSGPGTNNSIAFRARLGVTFKVLDTRGDWIRIEHESGRTGWIFEELVWGAK